MSEDLPEMPSAEQRAVAFEFGRKLSEPAFRDYVRAAGHRDETPVLTFLGTEPLREVLARLRARDPRDSMQVLLACPDPTAPHGWSLIIAGLYERTDTP